MTWSVFIAAWHWRRDVLAVLCLAVLIYLNGWVTLRRQGFARVATRFGLLVTLAGWSIVGVALLSPLDVFQTRLFSVHMVQHELLMVIGPPLVLAGHPLPVALWGLPSSMRAWAGRLMRPRMPLRRVFDRLTSPVPAWAISTAILWAWHLPIAYNAVESNAMLHNVQHLSFFAAGLLFWWPVIGAAPVARYRSLSVLSCYLIAGMAQRSLLGALITLSDHVLYRHYELVLGITPAAALADQHVAGAIMWFGSGFVLLAITVGVIWRSPAAQSVSADSA